MWLPGRDVPGRTVQFASWTFDFSPAMSAVRFVALLFLAVAAAMAAAGFFLYAGAAIPYPDPTPELLAKQAEDIRMGQLLLFGGLFVLLADALWLWRTRRPRGGRATTDEPAP